MDARVQWVLCLALLVPLAQGWSGWHALSHLGAPQSNKSANSERDSHAAHLAHCELCLAAAAIDAMAPPASPQPLAQPNLGQALALFTLEPGAPKQPLRAYQSRAPPTPSV